MKLEDFENFEDYVTELLADDSLNLSEFKKMIKKIGRSDDDAVYSVLTKEDMEAREEAEAYIKQAEEDGAGIDKVRQRWFSRRLSR